MALPDKTGSESDAERDNSAKECRVILDTQTLKEAAIDLLANENELLDSDSETSSTKDHTKDTNCAIPSNSIPGSSTVSEDFKSIIGSPPDCEPNLLENYKTPHSQKRTAQQQKKKKQHGNSINSGPPSNSQSFLLNKDDKRKIPDAIKKWPGSVEVWLNMVYNEEATLRSRNARNSSSGIHTGYTFLPRMRAILIDWIMEVCDVYQLRRNTYYLAVDYIDRFLDHRRSIPKTQLQLVGVTCLFIAAKMEEIYPPKLSEFAYVCDGACTENEILTCERLVLHSLGWDVNPMTPTTWLNLYMQIACMPSNVPEQLQQQHVEKDERAENPTGTEIYFPAYSAYQFVRASQVMDLFSLDPAYARFTYSVIAAAAMHLEYSETAALAASGLSQNHIDMCVGHMSFFRKVLCEENNPRLLSVLGSLSSNSFQSTTNSSGKVDDSQAASYRAIRAAVPNLVRDEKHTMQTHCVDLDYYERAVVLRLEWLGFKVDKVYTKQYNTKTPDTETTTNGLESKNEANVENLEHVDNSECNDKNEEPEEEEPPDFSTVVTFQLERLWNINDADDGIVPDGGCLQGMAAKADSVDTVTDAADSEEKSTFQNDNIFALPTSEKLLVNFDGILSSVHLHCTDKMFLSLWHRRTNRE